MSVVDHLKNEVDTIERELESVMTLIAQSIDKLHEVSSRLNGGTRELLSDVDLSGLNGIRNVLEDIPEDYRKDPGNSPYFDKLDKIMDSLSD